MAADSSAATAVADAEMAVAITAVSGSSYCFSSAVAEMASALAVMDAAAIITVAVAHHGITAVEILAETTVAANLFENGLGGIFGCPSCHENNPAMIETLFSFTYSKFDQPISEIFGIRAYIRVDSEYDESHRRISGAF